MPRRPPPVDLREIATLVPYVKDLGFRTSTCRAGTSYGGSWYQVLGFSRAGRAVTGNPRLKFFVDRCHQSHRVLLDWCRHFPKDAHGLARLTARAYSTPIRARCENQTVARSSSTRPAPISGTPAASASTGCRSTTRRLRLIRRVMLSRITAQGR